MARTGRPKQVLVLEPAEREQLQRWARRPKSEQRLATRSRIVLRCADGLDNDEVAAELGVNVIGPDDYDYGKREGSHRDPDGNLLRFGSPLRR